MKEEEKSREEEKRKKKAERRKKKEETTKKNKKEEERKRSDEEWKRKTESDRRKQDEEESYNEEKENRKPREQDVKEESKKTNSDTASQKVHYIVVDENRTLRICFIQDSPLLISANSLYEVLKVKAEKKQLKLDRVHTSEYCKPNEQPTNKVWDVSIYIRGMTERMEWDEMLPKVEKIRGSTKHIILLMLSQTTDPSKTAKGKKYDKKPENVFVLLVNRDKKELHVDSEWESTQENLLVDYLLKIS